VLQLQAAGWIGVPLARFSSCFRPARRSALPRVKRCRARYERKCYTRLWRNRQKRERWQSDFLGKVTLENGAVYRKSLYSLDIRRRLFLVKALDEFLTLVGLSDFLSPLLRWLCPRPIYDHLRQANAGVVLDELSDPF
jgi:hypothetical protein